MMNKKLFLVAILFVGTIITLSVRAEDLSNCKTVFNGKCYDNSINSNSNIQEQKCKTMVEGKCTEYYNFTTNYNTLPVETKQDMRSLNKKEQNKVCDNRFGFAYVLDPYANVWSTWEVYNQSKIFITNVEVNSPASRAGLKVGDEITRINGNRVVKFKGNDFDNYLDGQQTIRLDIKSTSGDKKDITLSRGEICVSNQIEPLFDSYWGQVCTYDLDSASKYFSYIGRVNNKLTPQFRADYNYWQNELSGWNNKKAQFRNGFNLCLSNNYNTSDVNNCLNQLVNRSINSIAHEQSLNMQRTQLQAQQQMQQQQVNAMNNYSNALRNQHVQVDANVYHSGTVNHNVNQNVNFNGTMYHY